jgi:hypothetical protein
VRGAFLIIEQLDVHSRLPVGEQPSRRWVLSRPDYSYS